MGQIANICTACQGITKQKGYDHSTKVRAGSKPTVAPGFKILAYKSVVYAQS